MTKKRLERATPYVSLLTTACSVTALAQDGAEAPSSAAAEVTDAPQQIIDEVYAIGRLKTTVFDVAAERLNQDVVADFIGAVEIGRVGDSSVSMALRRVPGLTLVNDQFVYVRGLGERYSSVLLNGAQVPSPDLTRNVIPLDIFPTAIIDALAVQKAYSPEIPAAFGGGNVDIVTRGLPNRAIFNVAIGSGANFDSNGTGLTYRGGRDDSLGTDDGTRAFPPALEAALARYRGDISPTSIYTALSSDGSLHAFSEAEALNRALALSLNRDLEIERKSLGPDGSLEIALGNRWFPGGNDSDWELGALGLVSYDNAWRNRERIERGLADPERLVENKQRTINQVSLTGVVNIGLSFTSDHEIATSSFFLRNTEDEAAISTRTTNNFQLSDGLRLRDYEVRFEERALTANQIRGRHVIGQDTRERFAFLDRPALEGLVTTWYSSDATAETDIPSEARFSAVDAVDPVTGELLQSAIRASNSAADYRFTTLKDRVRSRGWDVMKPLVFERLDVELSGGQDVSEKARSYVQTQFGLGTTANAAAPVLVGTPGSVFTDANIENPANGFVLSAGGIGTESYLAAQTEEGAFLKVDALLDDKWRFSGGARWEQFRQVSLPIDTLRYDVALGQCALAPCDAGALERIAFFEDGVYPAFSATRMFRDVWADDFQLRFGASKTVARPDLREVSAASYIDPLTETRIRGNPTLETSAIENFDVRAEWFFANGDTFTVSGFYKRITNPIETVQGAGTDDNISLTFVNAESANISGLEVEWLKDLSSFGIRLLEPLFFSGNVTLSDSKLRVGHVGFNVTHDLRRMAQHSKNVVNLQLGYDSPDGVHSVSLAYNTYGERLFFAGRDGMPDAFEQPFDSVDVVYSIFPTDKLKVKLRLQNLLDEKLEIEQGGVRVIEQSVGRTAKIDVAWDLGR